MKIAAGAEWNYVIVSLKIYIKTNGLHDTKPIESGQNPIWVVATYAFILSAK